MIFLVHWKFKNSPDRLDSTSFTNNKKHQLNSHGDYSEAESSNLSANTRQLIFDTLTNAQTLQPKCCIKNSKLEDKFQSS